MKKILITIVLITASTFLYSQGMDLNHKKIHIVDSTMGLGITPTSRLHVFGNGTTSNLFKLDNNKGTANDSNVIVKANGSLILGDSSYILQSIDSPISEARLTVIGSTPLRLLNMFGMGYTSLKWSAKTDQDTIADYAQIMGGVMRNTYGANSGELYFQTKMNGSMDTRMYIDSAGKVGIGTTTPTYRLDMFGNGGTGNLLKVSNDINSTYDSTFVIKSNGNVGIGNNTAPHRLYVEGSGDCDNIYSEYSGSYSRSAIEGRTLGSDGYGIRGLAGTIGAKAGSFENYAQGTSLEVIANNGIAIDVKSGYNIVDSTRFHTRSTTLSDNEQYFLPTNLSWKGEIDVDSLGYTLFTAQIRCDADGTPYLEGVSWKRWSSKTYVEVGLAHGYLNIIDGGSGMVIINTFGYTIKATLRFRTKQ